jgi:hypothetical protein
MTTTGYSLLDFILKLLGDPQAQEEFRDHPQQVLQQQGFGGLCAQDVHDALPLVVDTVQGTVPAAVGGPALHPAPPATVLPGESHLDAAIRQLQYVTNNYSYADSHDTTVDSSVHQNIWAAGDVRQSFDSHATTVSGDHDVTGNANTVGSGDVTGNGNAVGSGDSAGNGNEVHTGDGATNFGNGHVDDNSTHATVGGFGSGEVAVTGAGSASTQSDSHATDDSSHSSTVDSHDVSVQEHDPIVAHDGGNPCPETEPHNVHGDNQHGLVNVDHVLSDDNVNLDLLHNVHL